MSLILDALNKSERERTERDNAANIHAVHGSSPENAKPLHHRRWFWEVMVVVLILLLVYGYTEFIADQPLTAAPTTAKIMAPAREKSEPVMPAERPLETPVVEPPVPQPLKRPAAETTSSDAVRQLYKQPVVVEAPPAVVAEPAPVSAAAVPAIDKNAQWVKVPLIAQLPPSINSGIASIDFSVHLYSDEEGASFVKLNGERRKEGDLVAPGLRLVKIFEHGVILEYQGTQFRLLPLSGWVNM